MKNLSKAGIFVVLLYWIAATSLIIYALNCSEILCGYFALFATLPMGIFTSGGSGGIGTLILVFILNTIIYYYIGVLLAKLFKKITSFKS
jgi:hypothetical protein